MITEPSAIVGGSAAFLLSRWLRTPAAIAAMRSAPWLHGPDVAEALNAVHEAGRAWEATIELRERNSAIRCERPGPNRGTLTVTEASEHLGIGERRVQQLARAGRITGRRVGRRWELDVSSVTVHQQQRKRAA